MEAREWCEDIKWSKKWNQWQYDNHYPNITDNTKFCERCATPRPTP